MVNEPEQSTKPEIKKQTELLNYGDLATVSINYSLSMSLDNQSARVEFGVHIPCVNGIAESYITAGSVCEELLPEKLKELQLLVCHLKNTKDKIEKGELNPLAKVQDDAS